MERVINEKHQASAVRNNSSPESETALKIKDNKYLLSKIAAANKATTLIKNTDTGRALAKEKWVALLMPKSSNTASKSSRSKIPKDNFPYKEVKSFLSKSSFTTTKVEENDKPIPK